MQHSRFVHLHLHTQYSLLDGAIRPDGLLRLAHKFKMPAVAITDHGNMFGAVDFYQRALKSGVKPIIGSEVYVAPGSMHDKQPPAKGATTANHLVLLIKNLKGYKNMCKLLSAAYLEGFYYKPRIDKELLSEHSEGLIALSACLHGEISQHLMAGRKERAHEAAARYKEIFPDRHFFLELQSNGIEEQVAVNSGLVEIGKDLGIPLVATNDCHYLKREEARAHEVLLCIQTGKTMNSPDRMKFKTDEFYFKSPDEMVEAFSDFPEALENTIEIAERCNLELPLGQSHLPDFPVPEGETLDSLLTKNANDGLNLRFDAMGAKGVDVESIKWHYLDRLKKELNVIIKVGFPGYFLIVADFIEYAKARQVPVGPGRGSAAGSLVAYALGITNLDPIRYNLLFERFLNPDRVSLPDIDIDFCIERRDEVIKYVTDKYGKDNVTQIITFGQMKARAVIRDVGRVLDMAYGEVDKIAKLVPERLNITIDEAVSEEPALRKLAGEDPKVTELLDMARSLEGLARHASTHAAGVVISNKPLVEYLPLYMGQKEQVVTTQYPMRDVERIGLVKFDFLGLRNLTIIDSALKNIKHGSGIDLKIEELDHDDPGTYKLLASAATDGIFQLESSGMKELLRKLKPSTFEDLMAAVALYRPGPLKSGMVDDFVKRKYKKVQIKYDHPALKDILENTYGVMVYQEQVMEIARVLAGFTPSDADILRKAMGKKVPEVMLEQRTRFIDGAVGNKVPKKTAEKIFDLMAHFAGYGFNKSHSAAYALIAYQTAYLKTHYPIEFMAALVSSNMGDTDKVMKYIVECRQMKIKVLPPDVNSSSMDFTVSGGAIRFGLAAVKNVGTAALESILAKRGEEPFGSLFDFLCRVDSRKVNKKVVESLIKCGAFDFTGQNRLELLSTLDTTADRAQSIQRDRELGQGALFSEPDDGAAFREPGQQSLNEYRMSESELHSYEKETLGFYLTSHPLEGHGAELAKYTTDDTESLFERKNGEVVAIGGIVARTQENLVKRGPRKGSRMAILRLEDLSGGVEVVVFSDLYQNVRDIISSPRPVVVSGRVEGDDGPAEGEGDRKQLKIIATSIVGLDEAKVINNKVRKTHIMARTRNMETALLVDLKAVLSSHPGASPVFLHLLYPGGREVVISLPDELSIDPEEKTLNEIKQTLSDALVRVSS